MSKTTKAKSTGAEMPIVQVAILKSLDDIIKPGAFEKETPERIEEIWKLFHANKHCLYAVVPKETYNKIKQRATAHPLCILPRTCIVCVSRIQCLLTVNGTQSLG